MNEKGLSGLVTLANGRGVLSENENETEEEKIQNADKRIQYECTRIIVKLVERGMNQIINYIFELIFQ